MTKQKTGKPLVSIIIPVLDEQESIPMLYGQLNSVLKDIPYNVEIIFVDDGSTDGTLDTIRKLASKDRRIKAISFSRNFGHQAALLAGLDAARGDATITMDGDLQHPPRLIPELLAQWTKGFDVVLTVRKETEGGSRLKMLTARWFYALMNSVGSVHLPANTADFRLLARPVVDQLCQLEERALFLRGLVRWVGFRQTTIEYVADRRFAGMTKYSFRSMLKFAADGITSFSTTPLLLSLYFGFCVSLMSFLYGLYAVYMRLFTTESIPGWASILVAVLFLGGVQLMTIGILGLYVGKLFQEVKKRPRYIIRETIGGDAG